MARISLFQSTALAVLAAVGAMAVPAQAHPAEEEPDRQEARAEQREARQQQRAERQVAAPQYNPAPQAAALQDAAGARTWNRGGEGGQARVEAGAEARQQQRATPEDGWRSQRAPEGQRYGRNWDNGGTVSRPAPADNGATPPVPERGSADGSRRSDERRTSSEWSGQRNRTYSDPSRNSAYRSDNDDDHNNDRSGESWRDRHGNRNDTYSNGISHNGYRDGHSGDNHHDQNYAYRNDYSSGSRDRNRWDHNDWRRDTRYNWFGYRNQHRDLYRAGRYYSPYSNYGYSRLSIGFFLNSGFFGQNYWINDPWQYRLPAVYGPYRWVRYYDDVLLVDIYSGEVVDVIHDFFW